MRKLILLFLLFSTSFTFNTAVVFSQNAGAKNANNFRNNYFQNDTLVYTYNTKIHLLKQTTSGILLIKKLGETYRIVLSTPFGNTLMDGVFANDAFTFTYVVEDLNKKIITKTLALDFQLLLQNSINLIDISEKEGVSMQQTKLNHYLVNRFFDVGSEVMLGINCFQKKKKKVEFMFEAKKSTFADQITIQHFTLPLTIELLAIENEELHGKN